MFDMKKIWICPWGLTGSYTIRNWRAGDPFCKHVLLNCVVRSSLQNTSCQSMVHWLLLLPTFHGVLKGSDSFSAMTLLYILNISFQKLKLDKLWNKTHLHQVLARLDCECDPNLGVFRGLCLSMAMTGLLHFSFPTVCCSGRILDDIFQFVKVASCGSRSLYALLLLTGGHGGFLLHLWRRGPFCQCWI